VEGFLLLPVNGLGGVGVLADGGRVHLPHLAWLFDGQQMMSISPHILGGRGGG